MLFCFFESRYLAFLQFKLVSVFCECLSNLKKKWCLVTKFSCTGQDLIKMQLCAETINSIHTELIYKEHVVLFFESRYLAFLQFKLVKVFCECLSNLKKNDGWSLNSHALDKIWSKCNFVQWQSAAYIMS